MEGRGVIAHLFLLPRPKEGSDEVEGDDGTDESHIRTNRVVRLPSFPFEWWVFRRADSRHYEGLFGGGVYTNGGTKEARAMMDLIGLLSEFDSTAAAFVGSHERFRRRGLGEEGE